MKRWRGEAAMERWGAMFSTCGCIARSIPGSIMLSFVMGCGATAFSDLQVVYEGTDRIVYETNGVVPNSGRALSRGVDFGHVFLAPGALATHLFTRPAAQ